MALFGTMLNDVVLAFIFGVIGGLGAELINNKGSIAVPHKVPEHLYNAGVFSNLVIGGIAAWALFFLLETSDPARFIGTCVVAGVGGSGSLIAMKEKMLGAIRQKEAEKQSDKAHEAGKKLLNLAETLKGTRLKTLELAKSSEINVLLEDARATGLAIIESAKQSKEVLKEMK